MKKAWMVLAIAVLAACGGGGGGGDDDDDLVNFTEIEPNNTADQVDIVGPRTRINALTGSGDTDFFAARITGGNVPFTIDAFPVDPGVNAFFNAFPVNGRFEELSDEGAAGSVRFVGRFIATGQPAAIGIKVDHLGGFGFYNIEVRADD